MNDNCIRLTCLTGIFLLTVSGHVHAQDEEYGYTCENCPTNWENLDIDGNNCGEPNQSPIAFSAGDARGARSARVEVDYSFESVEPDFTLTNIEWGNEASSYSVWLKGKAYVFQQFHFHTTGEHVVNGERADLEMHFVNKTSEGATIVLTVLIDAGEENAAFYPITENLPGAEAAIVDLRALLPKKLTAYAYTGSTTTPPCSADVEWRLFKTHVELSQDQIEAIRNDIREINAGFDNNRTIQNREGRNISVTGKANK